MVDVTETMLKEVHAKRELMRAFSLPTESNWALVSSVMKSNIIYNYSCQIV